MIPTKYQRRPLTWWKGRMVRATRELRNGWATISPGTMATVENKRGGLELRGAPCEKCGVRISISRVPYDAVEFVEDPID